MASPGTESGAGRGAGLVLVTLFRPCCAGHVIYGIEQNPAVPPAVSTQASRRR